MRSLFIAASSFIAGMMLVQNQNRKHGTKKPDGRVYIPVEPSASNVVPEGYIGYTFKCWLCDGVTPIACRPQVKERSFEIDCSRCGVENYVKVRPFRSES